MIFRYTDTKTREHLAQLQGKFGEVQALHASIPKKFEGVDWGKWRSTIKTPGVVDQFQKEYDQQMTKVVKLNTNEIENKKRSQEVEIRSLEQKAATSEEFLKELKSEIDWTQQWYENTAETIRGSWISWNRFKLDNYYPNYKIHRVNRMMFLGDPMQRVGRAVEKIRNVDLVELRKQLESGNVRAMAAVAPIFAEVGDLNSLQRPFIKKWVKATNYEEAFKNPNTSLAYRAYALKQLE
jgi:hypothetical protein